MEDLQQYSDIGKAIQDKGEIMTSSAGTSMYPMLRNRTDMIVVEKLNRELKKDDVPLYRLNNGKLVLHRILKVEKDCYIIRGDNLFSKENVPKDSVIGVLKAFYRGGKYCNLTGTKYNLYLLYIKLSFPLRYVFKKIIRPFLSKIKRKILKKDKNING